MADPAITFAGTSTATLGAFVGWELQSENRDDTNQRAKTLDSNGDESGSNLFNNVLNLTANYRADITGATTPEDEIGDTLSNGHVITGVTLSTVNNDFATMDLTSHKHEDGNGHDSVSNSPQAIAHGQTCNGFGAKDFMSGTAGAAADIESGSVSITCQHVDELASDGTHLVGENYDAMMEASTTWTGVPSANTDGSWDEVTVTTGVTNTGFLKTTVNGTKALSFNP